MLELLQESGKDSQDKKKNHIKGLLVAATDCEPLYLIRLLQVCFMFYWLFCMVIYCGSKLGFGFLQCLQTKLRIGLAEQTLLTALGHAAVYSEEQSSSKKADNSLEEVRYCYSTFHY